jgi:hypothetical protein
VAATTEPAGLESSVGDAEHVCQEVQKLLMKVHSTLDRVCDISAPESTSSTMNGVLEALAVKKDGEDPLIAAVHRQVITGSESVFSMLMMHGVTATSTRSRAPTQRAKTAATYRAKSTSSMLRCYLHVWLTSWQSGTLGKKLLVSRGAA